MFFYLLSYDYLGDDMTLYKILKVLGLNTKINNIKLNKICRKEDEITSNTLFFMFDLNINKLQFENLRNKGAYIIIGQATYSNPHYLKVSSIKKVYQKYLLYINRQKLKNKILIGVTGSCGKSTLCNLIFKFLSQKSNSIYYGTNNIFKQNQVIKTLNTTPSMEEFFKYLSNEKYVIMEISSISYFEYRLFNINFNYILCTNIYEDHLDYHHTKEEYYFTKFLILQSNFNAITFISDDIKDDRILRLNNTSFYYGFDNENYQITNISFKDNMTIFNINTSDDYFIVKTKILGKYNINNISGMISLLLYLKYNINDIVKYLNNIDYIEGRYNIFDFKDKKIIIDYPHMKESYKYILEDVTNTYGNNIIVLYGAGGQRQKSKRSDYSKLVSKYARYAIISNDNPRFEDENDIISDLEQDLLIPHEVILNRKEGIKRGLELLNNYDIFLILGKGNEDYLYVKDEKINHNDINVVKELIK